MLMKCVWLYNSSWLFESFEHSTTVNALVSEYVCWFHVVDGMQNGWAIKTWWSTFGGSVKSFPFWPQFRICSTSPLAVSNGQMDSMLWLLNGEESQPIIPLRNYSIAIIWLYHYILNTIYIYIYPYVYQNDYICILIMNNNSSLK